MTKPNVSHAQPDPVPTVLGWARRGDTRTNLLFLANAWDAGNANEIEVWLASMSPDDFRDLERYTNALAGFVRSADNARRNECDPNASTKIKMLTTRRK